MMSSLIKITICLLFLLTTFVQGIDTIKCVYCRSTAGSYQDCEDPFDPENNEKYKAECSHGCMKVKHVSGGYTEYTRTCTNQAERDGCRATDVTNTVIECYCNSDYCNVAPSRVATLWRIVALAITALVLFR